jgi:hypothetical protein
MRWLARLSWGVVAAALYVAAVLVTSGRAPVRLLFDGFSGPVQYNWVSPPPSLASTNQPPQSGSTDITVEASGSGGLSLATGDAQASIVAPQGTFAAKDGQTAVHVSIAPLDPAKVGPTPNGLAFDGNAYTFTATYVPSGDPAPMTKRASILLRYPIHATQILRWTGTGWAALKTTVVTGTLQVFAGSDELGTFVAVAPNQKRGLGWLPYISVGAIVLAGLAGLLVRWREGKRRAARPKGSRPTPRPKSQGKRPR